MTNKIIPSTKFKKDIKHFRNKPETVAKMLEIIDLLKAGKPVPAKYKPHKLEGKYHQNMECHIENDVLLIWLDDNSGIIYLIRFGAHSQLF